MIDTSNQIELARQWLLALLLGLALLSTGCGKHSAEHIYGRYRIDRNQLLAHEDLQGLPPIVLESVTAMATGLSSSVIYEFLPKGCAKVVNGDREPLKCEFVRVEKRKVVVFRSEDVRGFTRYLRLTPTDTGLTLDTGTEDIPLKRIKRDRA